jgi:hypothetical protein
MRWNRCFWPIESPIAQSCCREDFHLITDFVLTRVPIPCDFLPHMFTLSAFTVMACALLGCVWWVCRNDQDDAS